MTMENSQHPQGKKVLIIGGAGFIGSHLTNLCLKKGYEVAVYDNFSAGRREFLSHSPNLDIFSGDILDIKILSDYIKRHSPYILYHLAAIHHIPTCEKTPQEALRVNIEGTQNVLTACLGSAVKRILFASTGAVYDIADGVLSEECPLKPRDIYSISKVCSEELLRYFAPKGYSEVIIARIFNTVGRNETNRHVVYDIMSQLVVGKRKIEVGNLNNRRDYVHVEDVAEALCILGNAKITDRLEVFNIGSGNDYSVSGLINLCSEVIGETIEFTSIPELRRQIDRLSQLADIRKIQQFTGWFPKHTLKQALQGIWEELHNSSLA